MKTSVRKTFGYHIPPRQQRPDGCPVCEGAQFAYGVRSEHAPECPLRIENVRAMQGEAGAALCSIKVKLIASKDIPSDSVTLIALDSKGRELGRVSATLEKEPPDPPPFFSGEYPLHPSDGIDSRWSNLPHRRGSKP